MFSKVWHFALCCHPRCWFLACFVLGSCRQGLLGLLVVPGERGSGGAVPEDHSCLSHVLSPPGSFSKGVAEGEVDPSFGPLEAIRLSIQTDSPVWIILSEVS